MSQICLPPPPDTIILSLSAAASVLVVASFALVPRPYQNVVVVFSPWTAPREAIRRVASADAAIIRLGQFPFIVFAHPMHKALILRGLGAFLVLDASSSAGCLPVGRS